MAKQNRPSLISEHVNINASWVEEQGYALEIGIQVKVVLLLDTRMKSNLRQFLPYVLPTSSLK